MEFNMMSHKIRRRRNNSAFTLIELLLVLVILAVLASIVVVNFGSVNRKKDEAKVKTDISNLDTALEMYKADMGDYPPSLDGLVVAPGNGGAWHGPYVKRGMPQGSLGDILISTLIQGSILPMVLICPPAATGTAEIWKASITGPPRRRHIEDGLAAGI